MEGVALPVDGNAVSASEAVANGIVLNNQRLLDTLEIMGVTDYDPLVLSALSEYARRTFVCILCYQLLIVSRAR